MSRSPDSQRPQVNPRKQLSTRPRASVAGRSVTSFAEQLHTDRLVLRVWGVHDLDAAWGIYGHADIAAWLSPDMDPVPDVGAMALLLRRWIYEHARLTPPTGRWAIERREDGRVIGSVVLLPLPPGNEDLQIGWQLHPDVWSSGYAAEWMHVLAAWAFAQGVDELFAVVQPSNTYAAAAEWCNGMQWVGETAKYFGVNLHVFRLCAADLDRPAPGALLPPGYGAGARPSTSISPTNPVTN